jgi:transposase InsO family protein
MVGSRTWEKKARQPKADRLTPWTREVHHTWQIDGKEHVCLANGDKVSWLNVADEGSGSLLSNRVNPNAVMTQWSEEEACAAVEEAFIEWTLPEQIKIDNGLPFVNSKCRDNPTMPVLWWVSMGIQVILNTPRQPQENGIVENLQGTTYRWVDPSQYQSGEQFQEATQEIARRQREVYRIRRKGDKTRKELYPQLEQKPRPYKREDFSIKRVYKYLAEFVWERKVQSSGRVKLFGDYLPVGYKWRGQKTCVTFDPALNAWIITLAKDGTQLNIIPNTWITKETIFQAIGFSKN